MWIVRLALRRPYTFVVMSMMIALLGGLAIVRMPTDIFPEINIPIVNIIWTYTGISAEDMAKRIVTVSERGLTTTVNDIEHMESQSVNGTSLMRLYFHPDARIEMALAQISASTQSVLRVLPPGLFPPFLLRFNASSVPILQLSVSSPSMTEQEIYDYGYNFIRTQMATVQGASVPLPYGGKPRQIMVDLDPKALYANQLSATDVANAINAQNLLLPAGTARIGDREYNVRLNSSPELVEALNEMPIKQEHGATVYVRDVAQVRDGYAVQNNIVRQDGRRSTLITVLKSGGASTLDIVRKVKEVLPRIMSTLPPDLNVKFLFDQSLFVRAAIDSVVREAVMAALLTGLVILLFLGSWRSTLIVCISIPLSILTALVVLYLCNQTINVMTLGGMALAVGILVDDATVAIENIHRNFAQGKTLVRGIIDGAQQIAVPAFVSTLCICIVFVPVVFLKGAAKFLFTPLAAAVVLAMMASYVLSRTLVPTMVRFLLGKEVTQYRAEAGELLGHEEQQATAANAAGHRGHRGHRFNRLFGRFRESYRNLLEVTLRHRWLAFIIFLLFCGVSVALYPYIGHDFFPRVDAGQFRLHVRGPAGMRVEETEQLFGRVEETIRREIPAGELTGILDNIGLPFGSINLAFTDSSTISSSDGEILVSLKEGQHGPTWEYVRDLRKKLRNEYPQATFFFQPSDIVSQILNFGLPAPIDVQVVGRNEEENYRLARRIEGRIARIPGAADVHLHQVANAPTININVDRTRASQMGLTQRDVANSMLISLSSTSQVAPNYWLNPVNGVNYLVAVQTPPYRVDSTDKLGSTPINFNGGAPQLLSNLAGFGRGQEMAVVNHYNVQPVLDIYANVENRDLGSFASDVDRVLGDFKKELPRGTFLETRGQVETMNSSFLGLGLGMIFAVVLVYLIMVVNFQSWLDPFIILTALPGALCGILWMLFLTQTTFSVPALMGAIMSIGVATANSILLVTFANDERALGMSPTEAALEAGYTRLRPVIMTALAMIIGMLPMAIGFGEGGEQNAPLGRAVIGGLVVATFATLFFVPVVYSVLRRHQPKSYEQELES
ncbi:MAG TPA: efflux RND transporter permease subunit [Bryobacteraceae bacterium]|nr:efflux RND transporter permease subunit [Bryobacteraceae bacterium]